VLLAKTLRSSTFRLALIAIAAFGLIVAAIMAYVYFGTIAYVQNRVGDAGDHSGFTAMIELAMAAVAVLMLVLAGLAAVLVTRRTVGRIEEINATSRAIMMSGLDQRIPLRGSHDEWDRVAENLNQMLDRIETLMGEVKQVSDNVAHDLRTPLTRMRQRLERLHDHAADPLRGELGRAIEDLDTALSTFDALLRLARVEEGSSREAFAKVDLSALLRELAEVYAPVAEDAEKVLSATIVDDVFLSGDRPLLVQMVVNGLENAIRHTPPKTIVRLNLARAADEGIVLDIADNGGGIAAADRERALLPLVRLDASRTGEGSGVGLALCKAIAELHGGELSLLEASPGLCLRFLLPASRF